MATASSDFDTIIDLDISGLDVIDPIASVGTGNNRHSGSGGSGSDGGSGTGNESARSRAAKERWAKRRAEAGTEGSGEGKSAGKKATASPKAITPDRLTPFIMAAHMILAQKIPEMAMTIGEAEQLSTAVCNYLAHTKAKLDPKTEALMALIGVVAVVEGTRIIAVAGRKGRELKAAKMMQAEQTTVYPAVNPNVYQMPMGGGHG